MCAWSRRRGSEAAAVGWLLLALAQAAAPRSAPALPALPALPRAAAGTAAARPVEVRLAGDARTAPAFAAWLREDAAWAARLPLAARRSGTEADEAQPPGPGGPAPAPRPAASLLRDRWLARGHLAATVTARDGEPAAGAKAPPLVLEVRPGPAFVNGEVTVEGPEFPGRDRLLAALPRAGTPLRAQAWDEAVDRVLLGAAEAGFPFARWAVRGTVVDSARARVSVAAILFTGPRAVIGPQTTDLPRGRGAAFVRRASGLAAGAPYRESDLARARDRLLARGLWAQVGEPALYPAGGADTVGVHWPLVAAPRPNRFHAVVGLSRRDEGGAARLTGQAELLLPNLAGTGRRLATDWFDDGVGRSRFGFGYLEPLAFGTPIDVEGTLAHEVAKGQYTRFTFDLKGRLSVVAAWGLELGLGWDRGTFPEGTWTRTSRWRGRAAFLRRRLDPGASGWSATAGLEQARRQAVARVDTTGGGAATPAGGSVERQTLYDVAAEGEVYLGPALSLAARGAYEEVRGEGGAVPLSEQYRLGGARSVRGWNEGEFHGERVAHAALELRIGKYGDSRLYTFFDIGYFRFRTAAATVPGGPVGEVRSDTVHGYGLGLQTRAAGGDVALAIGLPGTWDFDRAKLHVSLLQTF